MGIFSRIAKSVGRALDAVGRALGLRDKTPPPAAESPPPAAESPPPAAESPPPAAESPAAESPEIEIPTVIGEELAAESPGEAREELADRLGVVDFDDDRPVSEIEAQQWLRFFDDHRGNLPPDFRERLGDMLREGDVALGDDLITTVVMEAPDTEDSP